MKYFILPIKMLLEVHFMGDTPQFNGHRNYAVQAGTLEEARNLLFPYICSLADTNECYIHQEIKDFYTFSFADLIKKLEEKLDVLDDDYSFGRFNLNEDGSCSITINDADDYGYERIFTADPDLVELSEQEYAFLKKHSDTLDITELTNHANKALGIPPVSS
ncbi:hypothetical protein [Acinetobacter sp. P1(2025)]|uniref:hypothetical protein n=1 Tax=Acinetobacter sp. P1(2025) TaxID=3446120 RepID=UPI003F535CE1